LDSIRAKSMSSREHEKVASDNPALEAAPGRHAERNFNMSWKLYALEDRGAPLRGSQPRYVLETLHFLRVAGILEEVAANQSKAVFYCVLNRICLTRAITDAFERHQLTATWLPFCRATLPLCRECCCGIFCDVLNAAGQRTVGDYRNSVLLTITQKAEFYTLSTKLKRT